MSGRGINNISRKDFLIQCGALALIPIACSKTKYRIPGSILGANSSRGHQLRKPIEAKPSRSSEKQVVIVGGGVAGLSAAYELRSQGIHDFVLLELNNEVGGNAASGQNHAGKYPWGAHYLPVPDHRDKKLLKFLEESHVITGYDKEGLPVYEDEYLCFDPEERLYINGFWQEGLVPKFGVPQNETEQITRFFKEIDDYKNAVGEDGKDAFCIPVHRSSNDAKFKQLDELTFAAYLKQKNYTSPYLLWYLDYCTKDDYGGTIDVVSAWAGIHYFAARKGKASNTNHDTVLTWPEGNAWLTGKLRVPIAANIITDAVVFHVKPENGSGKVCVRYLHGNECVEIIADDVIMATPQYINERIVRDCAKFPALKNQYAPWMVANVTIETFYENTKGLPMCWDNVIYGSKSLGYVNASHQHITQNDPYRVLTFYYPLCDSSPREQRQLAMDKTHEEWTKLVVDELKVIHQGIEARIRNIDIWIWGHGMVLPVPGLQKQRMDEPLVTQLHERILLAHSDQSGISIFEEAFHQGINAAQKLIHKRYATR